MYEKIDLESPTLGTTAFVNHDQLPKGDSPDRDGHRVSTYLSLSLTSTYVVALEHNFNVPEFHFIMCPDHINVDHLLELSSLVHSNNSRSLINKCNTFCRDATQDWNSTVNAVTQSLLIGVVGIDEKDAEGATTWFLDMAMRFGMIEENDDMSWIAGSDTEER